MGKEDKTPNEDEVALFRQAIKGTRPLQHDRVEPMIKRPSPTPRKRHEDERQVLIDMMSDEMDIDEVESGEELLFQRPGLQHSVMKKLRRGLLSIEAELDLHGYTTVEARQALLEFLLHARQQHLRCVRIIHGKGNSSFQKKPVIKNKVNQWLRQRDEVLAFCSARPVDGGTGAIYLLLKRQ